MHEKFFPEDNWYDALETISKDDLSEMGTGTVAYIREVHSTDLHVMFPDLPPFEDAHINLWALLNADGTPILIADNREAAIANAFEQDLEMVSVH